MRSRIICFLLVSLLITAMQSSGQIIIQGKISDSLNHPVEGVNITYKFQNDVAIRGYTVSNSEGSFKLKLSPNPDSMLLSFSHIGYEPKTITIKTISSLQNIILKKKSTWLKDITVKGAPIYKVGDTINYSIDDFTSKGERTIGEVIKKLPGIEMQGDKILYHGKPLMKYYINGMDLLGGQYSLANKNLPVKAVKNIQIIKNDQPIKILDSLTLSNRASLNVKLKKFTTTGSASVGAGIAPFLWDINVTPMTFKKSFQMLNSIQANNIGKDVSKELKKLTANEMNFYIGQKSKSSEKQFTGIESSLTPPFAEERWLNNNVKLINTNILKKLNSDALLRANISYYNDYRKSSLSNQSDIYTIGKTVNVSEDFSNTFKKNFLQGRFSFEKNDKNIFLTDKLSLRAKWNNKTQHILQNDKTEISQRSSNQPFFFHNVLGTSFFIKNQLVSFGSDVSYENMPQRLSVSPGQFIDILNDSTAYNQSIQNVDFKRFYADNNMTLTKQFHKIAINTKLGFTFSKQWLLTMFRGDNHATTDSVPTDNDLYLTSIKGYLRPSALYQNTEWKIKVSFPLILQGAKSGNPVSDKNSIIPKTEFLIAPRLSIVYLFNDLWKASWSSRYTNNLGGIEHLYTHYILSDFNNLQRNEIPQLNRTKIWQNRLALHYDNPEKSSFANALIEYNSRMNDFLYDTYIDNTGATLFKTLPISNRVTMVRISADYSMYIPILKTIIKLRGSASSDVSPFMFHNRMVRQHRFIYNASVNFNYNVLEKLSFNLRTNLSIINVSQDAKKLNNIALQNSRLSINMLPFENQLLKTSIEYYSNNGASNKDQFFLNLQYQYTIDKDRIDLNLVCNNLLNTKYFVTIDQSTYTITRSEFTLRPRQFLFKIRFNF